MSPVFPFYRFSTADTNKNGSIDFNEFKTWHAGFVDRVLFKYYDSDGDGFIDKEVYFYINI